MLDTAVDQHQRIACRLRIEGEVLVFKGLAVEADQIAGLAEAGRKLVHDAALHAAVVMLRALTDLGQLELVDPVGIELIDRERERALKGCGRRKAGAQRHIAGKDRVESGHLAAALDRLPADAEDIAGPLLRRLILFVQAELRVLIVVQREGTDLIGAVEADFRHNALVNGTRENIATVIIGMLTDQVDATRGSKESSLAAEALLEFCCNFFFHDGNSLFGYHF